MNLKKRFLDRLAGKQTDVTPVGCTTTYGVVDVMKLCGAERPAADTDPELMAKLALAGPEHAGFEWVKAMGWDITPVSEVMGCTLGTPQIDLQYFIKEHTTFFDSCIIFKFIYNKIRRIHQITLLTIIEGKLINNI